MFISKDNLEKMFQRYIERKRYNQSVRSDSQDGIYSAGECNEAEKWLRLFGVDLSYETIQPMVEGKTPIQMKIKNMDPNAITSFKEGYSFLSNFFEHPVFFGGLRYRCAEAAFQAQKCINVCDRKTFTELSGAEAKKLGRQVALRPDWEKVKLSVMSDIIWAKFQDPALKRELLETGDKNLIEGNTWNDTFWGADAVTLQGNNHLGKILMATRAMLRAPHKK